MTYGEYQPATSKTDLREPLGYCIRCGIGLPDATARSGHTLCTECECEPEQQQHATRHKEGEAPS